MNVKRFLAPDMRRAINQVRAVHGPDAVILSSRSVGEGVEIVAAIDYDPELLAALSRESASQEESDQAQSRATATATADRPGDSSPDSGPDAGVGANARTESRGDAPLDVQADVQADAQADARGEKGSADMASTALAQDASAAPATETVTTGAAGGVKGVVVDTSDPALATLELEVKALKNMLREQFARLSWADMKTFDPERAALLRRVESIGIAPALAATLVAEVANINEPDRAWREVLYALTRRVQVLRDDPLEQEGAIALIGPTGVGKTTTIAKLAARHCLRYGRDSLALITTDNFRVGAQRQLDAFGAILGVPVRRADTGEELTVLLDEYRSRRLVLIDTAGIAPRDARLAATMKPLETAPGLRRFLVLSANLQESVMRDALRCFGGASLSGVVLSKLDEANGLGAALSALVDERLPVAWLSDGQRVPEDLRLARIANLIGWATRPVDDVEKDVRHAAA